MQINIRQAEFDQLAQDIDFLASELMAKCGILDFLLNKQKSEIDRRKVQAPLERSGTLTNEIWQIVSGFGTDEFTSKTIENILRARSVSITTKNLNSKIAQLLARYTEQNRIIRLSSGGGGRIAHRYKLAEQNKTPEEQSTSALDVSTDNNITKGNAIE